MITPFGSNVTQAEEREKKAQLIVGTWFCDSARKPLRPIMSSNDNFILYLGTCAPQRFFLPLMLRSSLVGICRMC